jgi:hypothetical protein
MRMSLSIGLPRRAHCLARRDASVKAMLWAIHDRLPTKAARHAKAAAHYGLALLRLADDATNDRRDRGLPDYPDDARN